MRISRLFKRLRRWSSQLFRKRHSPAAFRTCRDAGNSVLTAEGTTSKGTGSISCAVEFCIFLQTQSQKFTDKGCYLLTYLLTPYSTVLLEKLTGSQPVKKFPTFYGTRRFITTFTSTQHLPLSWANSIQYIPPNPTSWKSHPTGMQISQWLPLGTLRRVQKSELLRARGRSLSSGKQQDSWSAE
jgi:hypothetical protein